MGLLLSPGRSALGFIIKLEMPSIYPVITQIRGWTRRDSSTAQPPTTEAKRMTHTTDSPQTNDTCGPLAVTNDQYSAFGYDGYVVVYDSTNPDCWLQSDTTVDRLDAV